MQFPHISPASANDATAKYKVGGFYFAPDGNVYCYVKHTDSVTYAAGQPVLWATSTTGRDTVTNDVSGGSSAGKVAGVCLSAVTKDYYGFILVRGYYDAVLTNGDDDIAAGDAVIAGGADGVCDSAASPTVENYLGNAAADDVNAADTVAVYVDCL